MCRFVVEVVFYFIHVFRNMDSSCTHVLYVTSSKPSKGCSVVLSILSKHPVRNAILIQDVDSLRKEGTALPEWLNGTPTLVEIKSRHILKGSEVVSSIPTILDQAARRMSENQKARQAPVPDEKKTEPVEDINGLESVNAAGSWGEHDAEDPQYDLEAGCDPSEMNTGKVTDSDIQNVLKQRGMDMPKSQPAE